QMPVQDGDLQVFDILESNDVLFVDSSHVVKIGNDVQHILSKILPRLNLTYTSIFTTYSSLSSIRRSGSCREDVGTKHIFYVRLYRTAEYLKWSVLIPSWLISTSLKIRRPETIWRCATWKKQSQGTD